MREDFLRSGVSPLDDAEYHPSDVKSNSGDRFFGVSHLDDFAAIAAFGNLFDDPHPAT